MTTKVLPYNRNIVGQETGYWCGPASTQMALSARGKHVDEAQLARECRTHRGGTDHIGLIERVLDARIPEGRYTSVLMPNDPPTPAQKTKLWWDIVRSIDNGYAVVMNWVAPPGNKPRGVKGSPNPRYGGGTTYHYVTCLGWSDEGADGRNSVWIADSGFWPWGYWVDFEQCATLIPPKGYAFADQPIITPVPAPPKPPAPKPPPPPPPSPVAPVKPSGQLTDPKTVSVIIPNSYRPRGMPAPMWVACHTSESRSRVRNLNEFCRTHQVSYHRLVDDVDILEAVKDGDAPWAAVGANKYAYHICWTSSFASWSRSQWLDPNPSDGFNEREALRKGALQIAWWVQKSIADRRPIPLEWIGNRNRPPWGLNGICGHVDFGPWGGGHTDPGPNFPVDVLLSDVREFLTGKEQPPLLPLPPVVVPGSDPDKYGDWMLWAGNPGNNIDRVKAVQSKLKRNYAAYAGHLTADGVFGSQTKMAVMEFQRRSGLVSDGIVGPMTAAALKP